MLFQGLALLIGLLELLFDLASLHQIVLPTFALLKNLVADTLLGRVWFWNIFDSVVVLMGGSMQLLFSVMLLSMERLSQVRLDVVQIIHLPAFVIL